MNDATPPAVAVDHLTVRFGGLVAVRSASFVVRAGTVVGLIGPNGAGKSTLFNAVSGLVPIAEGTIHLLGHDFTRVSASRRACLGVARTFQFPGLVDDLTAAENIAIGLDQARRMGQPQDGRGETFRRAMAVLAGDRWMGRWHREAGALSTGYRRDLEIRRTVASDAPIIILDEPTVGIQSSEVGVLSRTLRSLANQGRALLLSSHDTAFVWQTCDVVHLMREGEIIASGPCEQMRKHPLLVEAYLGRTAGLP